MCDDEGSVLPEFFHKRFDLIGGDPVKKCGFSSGVYLFPDLVPPDFVAGVRVAGSGFPLKGFQLRNG